MKYIILFAILFGFTSFAEEGRTIKNESEAGIVIASGNTDISTLSAKQSTTLTSAPNSYLFNARFLRSSNAGTELALQWGLGLKFEHAMTDNLSFFIGQLVESNIYQNIFQRYATDMGAKYFFIKKEKELTWFTEGGYRFTRENYANGFKNLNFLRLYSEVERYFSETMSGKLWFEYLPNLNIWKAYQMNAAASLNTAISGIFSLKNAFELRYNNEAPAGAKSPIDRIFTTSLVAKF